MVEDVGFEPLYNIPNVVCYHYTTPSILYRFVNLAKQKFVSNAHRVEVLTLCISKRQGLNLRPDGPKPPALPTALIPVIDFFRFQEVLLSVVIYVIKTLPAPSHRYCQPYNHIGALYTSSFY